MRGRRYDRRGPHHDTRSSRNWARRSARASGPRGSAARSSQPPVSRVSPRPRAPSMSRRPSRSGWSSRAATPSRSRPASGMLWLLAGIASGIIGIAQMVKGPAFPWRKSLVILVPLYVAAIVAALLDGKTANMTNVFAGTLEYAVPVSLGAFAGILSERSGMLNIAIEGKFLLSACAAAISASIVATVTGSALARRPGRRLHGDARRGRRRVPAGLARHPPQGRPDHRRRRREHRRDRDHQLRVPAGPRQEHLAEHAHRRSSGSRSRSSRTSRSSGRCCSRARRTSTSRSRTMLFLTYMLFRTRWGLRLRASGEKPSAAGTVGHRRHQDPLPLDAPGWGPGRHRPVRT